MNEEIIDASTVDSRELFHATCAGVKFSRPPFWMMRQAGRYLPEYRALKEKYGFLGIVKTPEVAVEAALQPIRRFDFDCAIMFSDILVISEALGFPYRFKDGGGIEIERKIQSQADIDSMREKIPFIRENLSYVTQNLRMLRKALPKKAVYGFCGSPFTIGAYMVEGGSGSKNFPKYTDFFTNNSKLFESLMEVLAEALAEYAIMQTECSIDAFQIFDSHAALAPTDKYAVLSRQWIAHIMQAMESRTRPALFVPAMSKRFGEIAPLGAEIYSVDSQVQCSQIYKTWIAHYSLQGNLDPSLLESATPEVVANETVKIIQDMLPNGRHIFNLGGGIRPNAKIENVEAMCQAVKNFKR